VGGLSNTTGHSGTDGCTNSGTTTTCTIYNAGLNVINVGGTTGYSASWFGNGYTIDINGVSSTQWLVLNFAGSTAYTVSGAIEIDGQNSTGTPGTSVGTYAQYLLYNFDSSTSVTIDGYGFIGSILAPDALVTDNADGQFDGQLIAGSFTSGSTEFHNFLYQGQLSPEPAPAVFVGAGLVLLLCFRKRRRLGMRA
jgi:choice-of-anchor A domain-containing protein